MTSPRHPRRHRLRRAVKWAGVVAVVLMSGLWFASRFWFLGYVRWGSLEETYLTAARGTLTATWERGGSASGSTARTTEWVEEGLHVTAVEPSQRRVDWLRRPYYHRYGIHEAVVIPMWMLWILMVVPTAYLWFLDRHRFAPGRCRGCGYDLAGLGAAAVCPECGKGASA